MAKATTKKNSKAEEALNSSKNEVLVERDGFQRTFSRLIWDQLPPAKEGWKEVKENPEEPKKKTEGPKAGKKGEEGNKQPEGAKNQEPAKEGDPSKTTEIVLTQEDLDANPSFVEQGLKVGDTIEVGNE